MVGCCDQKDTEVYKIEGGAEGDFGQLVIFSWSCRCVVSLDLKQ